MLIRRDGLVGFVLVAALLALLLGGCASVQDLGSELDDSPRSSDISERQAEPVVETVWTGVPLPGKRSTRYRRSHHEGRPALHALADRSASMWRRRVQVDAQDLGQVRFSWNVPSLIETADLADRDAEDAPVRIVLAFDGDHARLSARDRMLFDLAETLTGERPPYATLMYVWDTRAPVGSVIAAGRSDRARGLVVESGPQRCRRWLSYERDVVADYRRTFGEEPGALLGVAVMTDSDNTATQAEAYYGAIELVTRNGLQPL